MYSKKVFEIPVLVRSLFIIVLLGGWVNSASAFSIPDGYRGSINPQSKEERAFHNGITVSFATRAVECGVCHQKEFYDWRYALNSDLDGIGVGTYHAQSSTEEMYMAMLNVIDQSFHFYCKGCHESGNVWSVADNVNDIPAPRTQNIDEGINCVVCHYDGSTLVTRNDLKDPLFCATCHNEESSFTDTYTEWLNDYQGTLTCQQCHMKKGSHLFRGLHSISFARNAVSISQPRIPDHVVAGTPFDIQFNLKNYGAGHSVPVDLLRKLRARVSIVNSTNTEISSYEKIFYKRFAFFGEDPSETEVIKAGEKKSIAFPGVVNDPGIYTLKVELLQDLNRLNIMNSTIFMGAVYKTFIVH